MGMIRKLSYHNLFIIYFLRLICAFSPADNLNSSFSNNESAAVAAIDIDKKTNKQTKKKNESYLSEYNTINVCRFKKKSEKTIPKKEQIHVFKVTIETKIKRKAKLQKWVPSTFSDKTWHEDVNFSNYFNGFHHYEPFALGWNQLPFWGRRTVSFRDRPFDFLWWGGTWFFFSGWAFIFYANRKLGFYFHTVKVRIFCFGKTKANFLIM